MSIYYSDLKIRCFFPLFIILGCYSPHIIPINNNLTIYVSEGEKWDLLTLVEKSFNHGIERIAIEHAHKNIPAATVYFAPKEIGFNTFEFGKAHVWHYDWVGGFGRVLKIKARQGNWYSDLQIYKTVKQKFVLKTHTILINKVAGASYKEIFELLQRIESKDYHIVDSNFDGFNLDLNAIGNIEKFEDKNISYKISVSTGRFQGVWLIFHYGEGKLYLKGGGSWII
jgi:hypothetical protein